jgi:hypothetical protein
VWGARRSAGTGAGACACAALPVQGEMQLRVLAASGQQTVVGAGDVKRCDGVWREVEVDERRWGLWGQTSDTGFA